MQVFPPHMIVHCSLFSLLSLQRQQTWDFIVLVLALVLSLHKNGLFPRVGQRASGGTHEIWWNEATRKTCVVPHHKEVRAGTLRNILRQAGVTEEQFLKAA
jgi:predicted RNA binding protein YcfA (HicA-like mRNA interferase family)